VGVAVRVVPEGVRFDCLVEVGIEDCKGAAAVVGWEACVSVDSVGAGAMVGGIWVGTSGFSACEVRSACISAVDLPLMIGRRTTPSSVPGCGVAVRTKATVAEFSREATQNKTAIIEMNANIAITPMKYKPASGPRPNPWLPAGSAVEFGGWLSAFIRSDYNKFRYPRTDQHDFSSYAKRNWLKSWVENRLSYIMDQEM
jgi:hypothetical protein